MSPIATHQVPLSNHLSQIPLPSHSHLYIGDYCVLPAIHSDDETYIAVLGTESTLLAFHGSQWHYVAIQAPYESSLIIVTARGISIV